MYVDAAGDVLPLWDGHLAEHVSPLPATDAQIEQFLQSVSRAIRRRGAAG